MFVIGQNAGAGPSPGRRPRHGAEWAGMSALHGGDGDHPALPTAGLAGQVSFVCYWAREFTAHCG